MESWRPAGGPIAYRGMIEAAYLQVDEASAGLVHGIGERGLALRQERCGIGRARDNRVILQDREASKHHAEIICDSGGYFIRDLGSSNGTFVNGKQTRFQILRPGDAIEIGRVRFTFRSKRPTTQFEILEGGDGPDMTILDERQAAGAQSVEGLRGQAAFEAVQRLLGIQDVGALCDEVLNIAFDLTAADSGAVLLFRDDGTLVPWKTRAARGKELKNVAISRSVLDKVLEEKRAVVAADAKTEADWIRSESVVLSGLRSLLCLPLIDKGKNYGVLYLVNETRVGAFGDHEVSLMLGVASCAGAALSGAYMFLALEDEAKRRASLSRFLAPEVVEQVMQGELDLERSTALREITVMFADIRGFTALTERSQPDDVVAMLNVYFDQMVEVIFEHHGTLDKFIGDAIMALWGAPLPLDGHARHALEAAVHMQSKIGELNQQRIAQGLRSISVGIGIATGECVVGAIGARRRVDYTAIGDRVNVAARLAALAAPNVVLVDEATFRESGYEGEAEARTETVKGRKEAIDVYAIEP